MAIETQSEQAREDLIKTEQALAAAIRVSAEQLLADTKSGRLSKAHPGDAGVDEVPPEAEEKCREAKEGCPVEAILIEE